MGRVSFIWWHFGLPAPSPFPLQKVLQTCSGNIIYDVFPLKCVSER